MNLKFIDSDPLFASILDSIYQQLWDFLHDPGFVDRMNSIFGDGWDEDAAFSVVEQLATGEAFPLIELTSASVLNGARGAYAAGSNTIYLSQEWVAAQAGRPESIAAVLLEEVGHYIDARINSRDAAGDEGAMFAAVVQGKSLSSSEWAALKVEQDQGTIVVNGQTQTVEFATDYGTVSLDGSLSDWTATDRLNAAGSPYELYGKYTGNAYVFAIKSNNNQAIAANTTVWLNTDQNTATGYQIFGFAGGAEYNVNFSGTGQPSLYTGAAGETLVAGLIDHAYNTDQTIVEFAVPITQLAGAPAAVTVLADVNDATFLPGDYSTPGYTVSSVPIQTVFGNINIDGNLNDWTATDRLDYLPGTGQPGYEVYGKYAGNAFVFAVKAPAGTAIGTNSTLWLDSDRNSNTGYQIFAGSFGGAEFQINIDPDGKPYLYRATGTSSLQRVSNVPLSFAFDSTQQVWEVSVPTALLGSTPTAINVYGDVNNNTFLPGDYTQNSYTVFANQTLPTRSDPSDKKIAIVYSETSANRYFSKTAYSQLFMSIQDEAMMAGIPFDLLNEADLKDMTKLVNYDTLVFPSFQHVKQADLQAIQDNLTSLVYQKGISIIAAGNFMTNNETGVALPDAYSRMRTLLNLQPQVFGTSTVSLTNVANSVLQGYVAGETIRTYNPIGWNVFSSVDPSKTTTLVNQTVNSGTYSAVVATQVTPTSGNNVHFASESYLGDTNLLWQALQWTTYDNQPSVQLSLTRNNSLFLSRNDMDLSQENFSVKPANGSPGIYDRMLPIVEQWKRDYNFVGSYYINIGNDPASGNFTDWTVSKPYYDRLLAGGNEIGTHSYTHFYAYQGYNPTEDTNIATDAQLKFEFDDSQKLIEQRLGINVTGAALPGAPETVETAQKIIQYFDYISGGYSSVGAGYPSAFGYLTPGQSSVYLAPNLYFDFTLLEFGIPVYNPATGTYVPKKLTAAEAGAEWIRQYNEVTSHANKPIVMMPWHDYGPTNWSNTGYTQDMFTGLIQTAYNSGAEFATLEDAAKRIKAFEQSKLTVNTSGNTITAQVQSNDVGKFGLDITTKNQVIRSVNNWYAYDADTVFLPKAGGTFTINLGMAQDDVTRIISLPMRGELLSLSGNGEDLTFSFIGEGKVVVDLKNPTGLKLTTVGADSSTLNGELLTLGFNTFGFYTVSVDLGSDAPPTVANPIANLTVNEDAAATTIDLTNVFTDPDDPISGITKSIVANSNSALVSTNLLGNTLTLSYLANQFGTANITVRGTSAGQTVDNTFTVNVTPVDDAPIVVNPIADRIVAETVLTTTIDLSNVFTDIDNDVAAITKSVVANSNPSLVSTSLTNNTLTLTRSPIQFGTAQITIRATSNGLTVDDTFTFTVQDPYNVINGTTRNDNLQGTNRKDRIYGNAGNDTIDGRQENDILLGEAGNDDIRGGDGADSLYGGAGNDTLDGGNQNDLLTGGTGNDRLEGSGGNDILIGVDPTSTTPGRGEIDTLRGGAGADLFILGDANQVYYNDGIPLLAGTNDYARIETFNLAEGDRIQLRGRSSDYVFSTVGNNTEIYLRDGILGFGNELIATVNVRNLSSTAFTYV